MKFAFISVPLAPKVFDTLLILVKEAGRVVTKDELMQQVWPDAFVEEGSIANNVSTLRKLLNPDFEGEGPIATVPRRGYRFTDELRLRSATGEIALHAPAALPVTSVASEIPRGRGIPAIHRSRRTMALLLVSGCVLVLAIVAYIYFVSRRQVISEKDTIVITDFTNKTGDAVFDDALKQALIFDLEQSPRLNTISDRKVTSTLLLMGRSGEERVTGETARELCQRVGSKAMLVGTISALESEYLIGLQAINCVSGDVIVAEQSRATGRGKVLAALDQAASRMREKLGESLASIQKFSTPVDEVTTPQNTLLQKYWLPATQAAIELQLKHPAEAIRILQPVEPMDLSLSFPLDFGAMYTTYLRGEAYLQSHQGKEAAAQFQKILDHPGVVINFALGSLAHLGLAGPMRSTATRRNRGPPMIIFSNYGKMAMLRITFCVRQNMNAASRFERKVRSSEATCRPGFKNLRSHLNRLKYPKKGRRQRFDSVPGRHHSQQVTHHPNPDLVPIDSCLEWISPFQ